MVSREMKAIDAFKSGLNCAQSVVIAFADDLGFDSSFATGMSSGFGGGMGRLQEKCGAVTGAFMVMGIYNNTKYHDNLTLKNETYAMVQKFDEKFNLMHGTTQCRALLNCDISSEEGHHFAKENNLFEKVCEKCIANSVQLVEALIKQ
jgi:C_GCAxxG_C_C family probable redox protein